MPASSTSEWSERFATQAEILRYVASRYMRGISRDEIYAGVVSVLAPRFEDPLTEPDLRDRFERLYEHERATTARLVRQRAALRGVISRLQRTNKLP